MQTLRSTVIEQYLSELPQCQENQEKQKKNKCPEKSGKMGESISNIIDKIVA